MSEIKLENVASALYSGICEFMQHIHAQYPELGKLPESAYANIRANLESPTGFLSTVLEDGKNGFELKTDVFESVPVYQNEITNKTVISTHDCAAHIADYLEDMLDMANIRIPNDEREEIPFGETCLKESLYDSLGGSNVTSLYGSDYDKLLGAIESTLIDTLEPVRDGYEYEMESEAER